MKFTINGFNQIKLIELGLTLEDVMILRYFIDFKDSGNMICEVIEGENYYWVKYEGLMRELPILNMKKDSLYRRFKKMCNLNILKHKTVKRAGNYSYYTVGSKYIELISDKKESIEKLNSKTVQVKEDKNTSLSERNPINNKENINNKQYIDKSLKIVDKNKFIVNKNFRKSIDSNENPQVMDINPSGAHKKSSGWDTNPSTSDINPCVLYANPSTSDINPNVLYANPSASDVNPCALYANPSASDEDSQGVRSEIRKVSDVNPEQKINLLKYSSTNKLNNNYKVNYKRCGSGSVDKNIECRAEEIKVSKKEIYGLYESNGFGLINKTIVDIIEGHIESYSKEWVEDAFMEAIKQNKCNLRYVQGILRNWSQKGKTISGIQGENRNGAITKYNNGNYKQEYTTGPSTESIRLENLAKERGFLKEGTIQDIECDF